MLEATLTIKDAMAEVMASAISPEAGRELPRTTAEVAMSGEDAVMRITAADASSMRAALNSYLECIGIIEDIGRLTEE